MGTASSVGRPRDSLERPDAEDGPCPAGPRRRVLPDPLQSGRGACVCCFLTPMGRAAFHRPSSTPMPTSGHRRFRRRAPRGREGGGMPNEKRAPAFPQGPSSCPGLDLNQHAVSGTTPSRWRVYQFHHPGRKNGERGLPWKGRVPRVAPAGLEPATLGLKVRCSTIELRGRRPRKGPLSQGPRIYAPP